MLDDDPDAFQNVVDQLSAQGESPQTSPWDLSEQVKFEFGNVFSQYFATMSVSGGYLNTVVKSKVRSLQQKAQAGTLCSHSHYAVFKRARCQGSEQPQDARRVLKPGLVSL